MMNKLSIVDFENILKIYNDRNSNIILHQPYCGDISTQKDMNDKQNLLSALNRISNMKLYILKNIRLGLNNGHDNFTHEYLNEPRNLSYYTNQDDDKIILNIKDIKSHFSYKGPPYIDFELVDSFMREFRNIDIINMRDVFDKLTLNVDMERSIELADAGTNLVNNPYVYVKNILPSTNKNYDVIVDCIKIILS